MLSPLKKSAFVSSKTLSSLIPWVPYCIAEIVCSDSSLSTWSCWSCFFPLLTLTVPDWALSLYPGAFLYPIFLNENEWPPFPQTVFIKKWCKKSFFREASPVFIFGPHINTDRPGIPMLDLGANPHDTGLSGQRYCKQFCCFWQWTNNYLLKLISIRCCEEFVK